MKNLLKLFLATLIMLLISCNNDSSEEIILDSSAEEIENFEGEFDAKEFESMEKSGRKYFVISREEAFNPILNEVSGKSTLIRGRRGIWARYKAKKLIPGHAYTLWWVIWNKPENCTTPNQCNDGDFPNAANVEVELLYASGAVAKRNGKVTFYSRLRAGNDSGSVNDLFGLPFFGGLQKGNTFGSEVHLVIRSHGPAIPGLVNEQIGGYLGGCPQSFPYGFAPFTEIPDAVGECGDIEFSIHAPVN